MSHHATGCAKSLAAQVTGETCCLCIMNRGLVLLQQPWSLVQLLALGALEAFCVGGTVQGHMCSVSILRDEMSRAVRTNQWAAWSVLAPHMQCQLEPESERSFAQRA